MTVRTTTFYRWTLLLPVVIPVLAGVAIWILQLESIGLIAAPLVLSLSYGGVPYVIGGLGLFFWMRGKRGSEIGRISYWVPLLLLPLLWLWMMVLTWPEPVRQEFRLVVSMIMYFSAWWLGLGYAYVALIHLARFAAEGLGWLS
jgi:hypothetical protein